MPVVAVCAEHGAFASRAIQVEGSTNVTLSNNFEPCPRCGRMASIMDGVFDFNQEGLATVLSAPGWSRRALRLLQQSVEDLSAAVESDDPAAFDQILERLEQQDEQLAHLITAGITGQPKPAAVRLLTNVLAVFGGIVTLRETGQITTETVRLLVEQVFN